MKPHQILLKKSLFLANTLKSNLLEDNFSLLAAGIAFYFLLAAFPALAALISLFGLYSDPRFIGEQIDAGSRFLPHDVFQIFSEQARKLASAEGQVLGLSFFISMAVALYSTSRGINALIKGFNIAYKVKEKRHFMMQNIVTFILTIVIILYLLISLSMIAIAPALFKILHLPYGFEENFLDLRWPFLFFFAYLGLQILYHYGPALKNPPWRWMNWGALIATILWLFGSGLFSMFVSNFGAYNETYGSLGAAVVLLIWLWYSAVIILFGAEVNASIEAPRHDQNR